MQIVAVIQIDAKESYEVMTKVKEIYDAYDENMPPNDNLFL